jgi:hypothetical protein
MTRILRKDMLVKSKVAFEILEEDRNKVADSIVYDQSGFGVNCFKVGELFKCTWISPQNQSKMAQFIHIKSGTRTAEIYIPDECLEVL